MLDLLLLNVRACGGRPQATTNVGIWNGWLAAVGDEATDARADRIVDCQGAYITPGFGDAHNHMAWFGISLMELDLSGCTTRQELYQRVSDRAARSPAGSWVVGNGYDDAALEGPLDRAALDQAGAGRPVWLKHRSGHRSMVNSVVLERANLLHGPPQQNAQGGGTAGVVRSADGTVTGLLHENSQRIVAELRGPPDPEQLVAAITAASRIYAAEGLTHVVECGVGGGLLGNGPLEALAYQRAMDDGQLQVRVDLMPSLDRLRPTGVEGGEAMDLGVRTGFGSGHVRLGPVKAWLDGSLLGRTAAVSVPFCDGERGSGSYADDPDTLRRRLVAAHCAGWRLAMHAIGDRAVDLALDIVAEATSNCPRPNARHRVEHAAVVRNDQLERMRHLGVVPVPQARFLYEIGDDMVAALGSDRVPQLYRHRSFLEAGLCVPGSSDRPVATGAPLLGMQSMVERRSRGGRLIGEDERVGAEDALLAYTHGEAWACHDEAWRGFLRRGATADIVLLDQDPTAVASSHIGTTGVLATMLAGRLTHLSAEAPTGLAAS